MNNGHNKKTNSDSDNSAPQGIFSTPELTVDTEKIAPAQNSTDSKARVASFFANTDASKQAEQVQNAMIPPANYVTEDLVINNGGKKKRSFLPIIIAVVAILAIVGGVTAYFLIKNTAQSSTESPAVAFNNFREYLEKGPEGYRDEETNDNEMAGQWFVFRAIDTTLPIDAANNYTKKLNELYQIFRNSVAGDPTINSDSLKQRMDIYDEILNTTEHSILIKYYTQEVFSKFVNDGSSAALSFINDTIPTKDSTFLYNEINNNINEFLQTQLSFFEIYNSHSCIIDEVIDSSCSEELYNGSQALSNLTDKSSSILAAIEQQQPSFYNQLRMHTDAISNLVGDQNEQN